MPLLKVRGFRIQSALWRSPRSCRSFTASPIHKDDQHVTYFQPGSQRQSPPSRNERQVFLMPGESQSSGNGFSRSSFFFGLVASPFLLATFGFVLYQAGFIQVSTTVEDKPRRQRTGLSGVETNEDNVRSRVQTLPQNEANEGKESVMSPAVQIMALEKELLERKLWNLEEQVDGETRLNQITTLLESANDSQLKVHKVLFDLLTTAKDDSVILDNAIIESRPIVLSDKTRLPSSNAALIRVVDQEGKNKILVLGVDVDYHEDHKSVSSRFPGDCYELDDWLCELADDLAKINGNSEAGLAIYLYSNRVIVDVQLETGHRWMTRYHPSDFPPGFPLRQMRQVTRVHDHSGNLSNNVQRNKVAGKKSSPKTP